MYDRCQAISMGAKQKSGLHQPDHFQWTHVNPHALSRVAVRVQYRLTTLASCLHDALQAMLLSSKM